MTTRAVASLFGRAWVLAATLAVIAGLLGMHVLTSGHASHGAQSPAAHATAGHAAVAHSAPVGTANHTLQAAAMDAQLATSAACSDSCPGVREPGAPCVPSAPSGPLTVIPPQAGPAALPLSPAGSSAGAAYDYLPPSPTPCELSISRT